MILQTLAAVGICMRTCQRFRSTKSSLARLVNLNSKFIKTQNALRLPSIVKIDRGHHWYKSTNTKPCCDMNSWMKTEWRFTEYCPEQKSQRSDDSLQ